MVEGERGRALACRDCQAAVVGVEVGVPEVQGEKEAEESEEARAGVRARRQPGGQTSGTLQDQAGRLRLSSDELCMAQTHNIVEYLLASGSLASAPASAGLALVPTASAPAFCRTCRLLSLARAATCTENCSHSRSLECTR